PWSCWLYCCDSTATCCAEATNLRSCSSETSLDWTALAAAPGAAGAASGVAAGAACGAAGAAAPGAAAPGALCAGAALGAACVVAPGDVDSFMLETGPPVAL